MPITPLPTPPSRQSPGTFATLADAFLAALVTFVTETNATADDINAASGFVGAAMAAKWVSGTTYADGVLVWSPITRLTYRRKGAGAGTTDPSADTANWAYYPVATQAEAEAGTSDVVMMSPLRVAQAIVAKIPTIAASQAQMEAATANTVVVTPANAQWHPGIAKVWVQCGVSGNTITSHNVTSVTDGGTGKVTVNIAADFSSTDYAIVATLNSTGVLIPTIVNTLAAGTFEINSRNPANTLDDPNEYSIVCFGDQ